MGNFLPCPEIESDLEKRLSLTIADSLQDLKRELLVCIKMEMSQQMSTISKSIADSTFVTPDTPHI